MMLYGENDVNLDGATSAGALLAGDQRLELRKPVHHDVDRGDGSLLVHRLDAEKAFAVRRHGPRLLPLMDGRKRPS